MKKIHSLLYSVVSIAMCICSQSAAAQTPNWYSGQITWLEVWKTGNVAFRLSASGVPCNGPFILNKSDPGTKNQYALLVAAKLAGQSVTVYADACGAAETYGGNYAQVAYLYSN
jgi:hypothetical protein